MSTVKPEVEKFLDKSKEILEPKSAVDEFLEVKREKVKRENIRQIKDQLSVELSPLLKRLASIEQQQTIIIGLLKKKLDLDGYEKEIMDLLKTKLEKE